MKMLEGVRGRLLARWIQWEGGGAPGRARAPKPREQPSHFERVWWHRLPLTFAVPIVLALAVVLRSSGVHASVLFAIATASVVTYLGWFLRWQFLLPVAVAVADGVGVWIPQTGQVVAGLSAQQTVGYIRFLGTETWFLCFGASDSMPQLAYLGFMVRGRAVGG